MWDEIPAPLGFSEAGSISGMEDAVPWLPQLPLVVAQGGLLRGQELAERREQEPRVTTG